MKKDKKDVPLTPEDSALLGEIYEQGLEILLKCAVAYADNCNEAEDVTHDAFIKVIRYLPDLKKMSRNKRLSYMRVTVKTTVIDRKRKSKPEVPLSEALFVRLEARERDLLSDLAMDEKLQRLRHSLSPRDWLVLEGKHILGYSDEELAEILGVKPSSIRMILSRAYGKSRDILHSGVR